MKLYVAGINGLVGSQVADLARQRGFQVAGSSSSTVDFRNREATLLELMTCEPDALVIAAAIVGGIGANSQYPVKFLSDNLQIQCNLIDAAHKANVKKVVFLGSSCVYPKFCEQPIKEEFLLGGKLESTNQPYALAKIAGIELINSYRKEFKHKWISVMPCNLYGPNDNFDPETSHVFPALIRKINEAKVGGQESVTIWGDGSALREFLFVGDAADGILHLLERAVPEPLYNLGSGREVSVIDLARAISKVIGYEGGFDFDSSKPNGTPRKLMSSERMKNLGWSSSVSLEQGIKHTYKWFLSNKTFSSGTS